MESSIHFMKKSMYSSMNTKSEMPCLDLFQLTSELNRPWPQIKVVPLNKASYELDSYSSALKTNSKPNSDLFYLAHQTSFLEDTDGIQQILKSIPIYRDLKSTLTSAHHTSADSPTGYSGFELTPSGYQDWNYWYEQQAKQEFNCGVIKAHESAQNSWSSYNTMISSGSSPENTHPLYEDNVMKSMCLTHEIKKNYADRTQTAMNMHMNSYASQAMTLGPILVPDGSSLYIPPGYIRVDTQKAISRATKQVTNCEHVDRKHYAKGLCSTCYHKGGRTKLAWNCEHKDRVHYAKGCCTDCYVKFHSTRGKGKGLNQEKSEPNLD